MAPPSDRESSSFWPALEKALVILIAFHSMAIGAGALVATEWGLRFSGFSGASPLFFPRQVGVFHIVTACAYLIEYCRYRGVAVLVTTKVIAVLFLVAMMVVDRLPWVVPISALGDGLMLAAVLAVHRRVRRLR
jgi:hypothetical protein